MTAKKIAVCAVMVALLLAVQYIFSFIAGVELVSVLLLSFCYVFGVYCGLLTATTFSLLRCFLYGFVPNVIVLYLIYYNLFALIFGLLGKHKLPTWVCPMLLCVLAVASAYFAATGIPISMLYQTRISIMLWILFGIVCALAVVYMSLVFARKGKEGQILACVTALAAFCTVCFTLLDDIITPLFMGYSMDAALAYFYTGFLAMLPQTICVIISVFLLFIPFKKAFESVKVRK